jgi:hypothetical protein
MFQEDTMQQEKAINNSILKVNIFLAITAMLLSLIGMYNLVSLDIIRRTKEMGIRKIQGAPVPLIMYLASKKCPGIKVGAFAVLKWGLYIVIESALVHFIDKLSYLIAFLEWESMRFAVPGNNI